MFIELWMHIGIGWPIVALGLTLYLKAFPGFNDSKDTQKSLHGTTFKIFISLDRDHSSNDKEHS